MGNNAYREMIDFQQKEFNSFSAKYMFYAYSEKQYEDGLLDLMERNGLAEVPKLSRVMTGAFVLEDKAAALIALFNDHRAEKQAAIASDLTGEPGGFIYEMFLHEMFNHEFALTGDLEEVLDACGVDMEDFAGNEIMVKAFRAAGDYCIANTDC